MGYLYDGQCLPTVDAYNDAYFHKMPITTLPGATTLYIDYWKSGATWYIRKYSISSTGVFTLNFQTGISAPGRVLCDDPTYYADAFILAWAVVGVWAAAWAYKAMRKAVE